MLPHAITLNAHGLELRTTPSLAICPRTIDPDVYNFRVYAMFSTYHINLEACTNIPLMVALRCYRDVRRRGTCSTLKNATVHGAWFRMHKSYRFPGNLTDLGQYRESCGWSNRSASRVVIILGRSHLVSESVTQL